MSARVLVVDDILPNVKLLEAKLTSEYYDVLTATSGEEALKSVEEDSPDLVLLDVMMPGMDGPETLKALRGLSGFAATPVVFMTAKVQPSEVEQFKAMGAMDVVAKPFDPVTLPERIRDLWSSTHERSSRS